MALQIRRGTAGQRTGITPAEGELLYTTDTKLVYVGDGSTAGGNIISGGGGGDVVSDTTPQLGGDLDINGYKIVSSSNGTIELDPDGTGNVILHGNLTIDTNGNLTKTGQLNISPTTVTSFGNNTSLVDGNVFISRNSYSSAFGSGFTFAQHHATADAVNFAFYRTRGTGLSPLPIQNGDDISDIAFVGWDGSQRIPAATVTAGVDGVVSTGKIPGKLQFLLHDGITAGVGGIRIRAELRADGNLRLDKLAALTSTSITIPTNNSIDIGDVRLSSDGLSTVNSNANLYLSANASGRVYIENIAWPVTDGVVGQVLTTNGLGSLAWSSPAGFATRSEFAGTTNAISNGATGPVTITAYKTYAMLKIQVSHAAWVRLYVSDAARTADSSRAEGVDPSPSAGVIAEVVTTGSQTILMSPGVFGWNDESPVIATIPCAVTNKSGASAAITVTLTLIQLEA
jgi:hypothetical protein